MKVFSLFSGIGGFDIAAESLGWQIIGACEIDKYASAVYRKHFPDAPIHEDARLLDTKNLEDFDILTAGFPCQPFSIAGKRRGFADKRGNGFDQIVRIAKEKRPGILLLENVKGLFSHDCGRTFASILCKMDELGYDVQWQCVNSKYFVPQNRERIFIVGYLRGERTRQVFPLREINEWNNIPQQETCSEGQRIQDKISGAIDANYHKGYGSRTMICVGLLPKHAKSQTGRIYSSNGIARTMCSGTGGLGKNTGLYSIHKRVRRLTPTECEKLQGFPTNFTKHGVDENGNIVEISDTQRYKCLGNTVTVPVVQHIMEKISITDELECEV